MMTDYIAYFVDSALVEKMGECAYQRMLCGLCITVPTMVTAFALFSAGLVLFGIYKAVSRS